MRILTAPDSTLVTDIDYTFPLGYSAKCFKGAYQHDEIAQIICEKNLTTYMVTIVSERLAEEHWDAPVFIHKSNSLGICVAEETARKELTNRYYDQEALNGLIKKHELPTWRYNYKDPEDERKFIFELEDALFNYQVKRKIQEIIPQCLLEAAYKVDEEGWTVEDDNDNPVMETDPTIIEKRKEKILEDLLIPRVFTTNERVYNIPKPMSHWDYRSKWHQFFFVDVPEEGLTVFGRGHNGGSGSREENGRWAHTFAELAVTHGIETPSYLLRYNKHNELHLKEYTTYFRVLDTDLSGNYPSNSETLSRLFTDRTLPAMEYVYSID